MKTKWKVLWMSLCAACIMLVGNGVTVHAEGLSETTFGYAYDVQRGSAPAQNGDVMQLRGLDAPYNADGSNVNSTSAGNWTLTEIGAYGNVDEALKTDKNLKSIVSAVTYYYSNLDKNEVCIHELKDGTQHIAYGVIVASDEISKLVFLGNSLYSGAGYLLSTEEITTSGGVDVEGVKIAPDYANAASTPAPADPTPAPADPTPAPADPTPAPADPTPAPADPTPAPVKPNPAVKDNDDDSSESSAVLPELKTTNVVGEQIVGWDAITTALATQTKEKLQSVSGVNQDLLHVDANSFDKIIPAATVKAVSSSTLRGLHVFIGDSDAVTFLAKSDLSGYKETDFAHTDTVADRTRTIAFTNKQALGTTVVFHTTVPVKSAKVTVYKVDANGRTCIAKTVSNADGQVCFPITETATYVLEY